MNRVYACSAQATKTSHTEARSSLNSIGTSPTRLARMSRFSRCLCSIQWCKCNRRVRSLTTDIECRCQMPKAVRCYGECKNTVRDNEYACPTQNEVFFFNSGVEFSQESSSFSPRVEGYRCPNIFPWAVQQVDAVMLDSHLCESRLVAQSSEVIRQSRRTSHKLLAGFPQIVPRINDLLVT